MQPWDELSIINNFAQGKNMSQDLPKPGEVRQESDGTVTDAWGNNYIEEDRPLKGHMKDKFLVTVIVPAAFQERHIVTAVNIAIQQIAEQQGINLGGSLDWDVTVFRDWKYRADNEPAKW